MKIRDHFLGTLVALAGIFAILLIVADCYLIQGSFLDKTNNKYDIATTLHMSKEDVSLAAHAMIDYVRGDIEDAQVMVTVDGEATEFFTEKELLHLVDVRALVNGFMQFKYICLVVFILGLLLSVHQKKLRAVSVGVWYSWGLLLILSVVVGVMAYIDVDLVINGFHELFFDNDLWLLSYSQHRSLYMFQDCMYIDFLFSIAGILCIVLIGTIAVSLYGYWKVSHRTP